MPQSLDKDSAKAPQPDQREGIKVRVRVSIVMKEQASNMNSQFIESHAQQGF